MTKPKKLTEVILAPTGRPLFGRLAHRNGNIKELTSLFLGDLQDDWRENGIDALRQVREKSPELYVAAMVTLTKAAIIRQVDVNFQGSMRMVQSKESILDKLEEQSGPQARKLFQDLVSKIEEVEKEEASASEN